MTEKRFIIDTDCSMNIIRDTCFGFDRLDKPTEEEIMDNDYLIVCSLYSGSEAKEVCERLNQYEEENKTLKKELKQIQDSLWTTEHIQNLKDEIYDWKASAEDYLKLAKGLQKENKELKEFKKQVTDEIQYRYDLSNHKPVFLFMAKKLGLRLHE